MNKMTPEKGRRGYLYTISIIMIVIPLIVLLLFYTSTSKTKIDDTSGRIRCDELYYFVQDVEYDMERAMFIFGRRAAVYAIDDIVTNNQSMWNYTFNNCTEYVFDGNGSEAAIAELTLCGSLYGQNVSYMVNHTMPVWLDRIQDNAEEMGYNFNIDVQNLYVLPYDAWNFILIVDTYMEVSDKTGLCYYSGEQRLESTSNIIGLEDPLYPLHTNNQLTKYIYSCDLNLSLDSRAGCSTENWGNGTASGSVVFYSNIKDDPGLGDYCATTSNINEIILVFDMAFGSCNSLEYNCFNVTHEDHMAGVIDYAKNDPDNSFLSKCNITIPWIAATGKIDNETQQGQGHQRDPFCLDGDISSNLCVMINNIPDCTVHEVVLGYSTENIDTSCYIISNITQYTGSCTGEEYPNGPSFFDRLDGNLNLSEKYLNQSVEWFGNPYIGIETLVNPYLLEEVGITPEINATWVDYLYWQNISGSIVSGVCGGNEFELNLDCPHAYFYDLDTGTVNASGVEPISRISELSQNQIIYNCQNVSINGSADDCDATVTGIDVSINGVWYAADWDNSTWNYTLIPPVTNKYIIQSRATDSDGVMESPSTSTTIFIVNCSGGDNTPPSAPDLFSPEDSAQGISKNPDFFWDVASDASGIYRYQIQVDEGPPADWVGMNTDDYNSSTQYHQSDTLSNNRWYNWRVRAQDNSGNWGPWSDVWSFKT